jgi:predicted permease
MQLFLSHALVAMRQVVMLYIMVAIGFAAERIQWFPEATARMCTKVLLYIITPCVILKSFFVMEYSKQALRGLLIAFGCGAVLHIAGILISEPFFRKKNAPRNDALLHFAAVYGNCGYMALPLAQGIVGSAGVFYCSVVVLTFQIFAFSHGEFVMAGGRIGRVSEPHAQVKFDWKKLFLNAGVLSVAVGLPLFLLRAPVPELLSNPISSVAAMNSPLAMLMFGAYLSKTNFMVSTLLKYPKFYLTMCIKLFAVPAVVLAAMILLRVEGPLRTAMLISASAPSANNTVILAAKYEHNTGYAAQVTGIVSIVSILTMPLMIAVGLSV